MAMWMQPYIWIDFHLSLITEQCSVSADPGICFAYFPMWAYDVTAGKCKEFIYGGCDGNENRFETELACQEACYVEGTLNLIKVLSKMVIY